MDKLLDVIDNDVYTDYMQSKYGMGVYGALKMVSGDTSSTTGAEYLPINVDDLMNNELLELDESLDEQELLYEEFELMRKQTLDYIEKIVEKKRNLN